jgi:hypothetical protein
MKWAKLGSFDRSDFYKEIAWTGVGMETLPGLWLHASRLVKAFMVLLPELCLLFGLG